MSKNQTFCPNYIQSGNRGVIAMRYCNTCPYTSPRSFVSYFFKRKLQIDAANFCVTNACRAASRATRPNGQLGWTRGLGRRQFSAYIHEMIARSVDVALWTEQETNKTMSLSSRDRIYWWSVKSMQYANMQYANFTVRRFPGLPEFSHMI